jgi:2-methylisocitrate lyase-like PEP mutase family enzyme
MTHDISPELIDASNAKARTLRELLHAPEILVMPGAYDTLSAIFFESLGFKAIQGSSGGVAAVAGLRDGEVISRDDMVEVYRKMAQAVSVPVNADGEKGYGGPEVVAETVRALLTSGVVGMNLEDSLHHGPGEPMQVASIPDQLAKIDAFMAAKRELGSEFFLNARVDIFLTNAPPEEKLKGAIERGNAYAEHGADCIFFFGANDAERIGILAREVKAPISILANAACPSVQEMEDLGVARVSYGTVFPRVALAAIKDLCDVLLAKGDPAPLLNQAFPHGALSELLRARPID